MSEFNSLQIAAINRETASAISIQFDVPNTLSEAYQFTAGQYVNIKATLNNSEVRRAYSICSAPSSNVLTVMVKQVQGGVFSTYANQELKVGDTLMVAPPEGRFVLTPQENSTNTYMAFAAGSGITPVISMIETVLSQELKAKFILVYGNQSKEETIFFDRLEQLQQKYADRFLLEYVFSRMAFKDYKFGRIDGSLVNYFTKNKFANFTISSFYLCGPGEMIDTVQDTLIANSVDKNQIHFERFTPADSQEPPAQQELIDGQTTVTYIVDDQTSTVTGSTKKSLLETAMDNDLDPPYSCQGGICSSCIARVTAGSASMRKNQILTDSEVEEGLVLTCQAHATSATITVDYDDV